MTRLQWDSVTDRFFEAGLDRGVLYTPDGLIIPWNGLVSIDEGSSITKSSMVYVDGRAVYQGQESGDFEGTLNAFTYPEAFAECMGLDEARNGVYLGNQPVKRFGLSWRTKIGNGNESNAGYKIHILYNVLATPSNLQYQTLTADVDPTTFSWDLSTISSNAPGYRPTAHVVIDSRKIDPHRLESLERYLYGDDDRAPTPLGTLADLMSYIDTDTLFHVVDNEDGTWTVQGPDALIRKIHDGDWFIIDGIDATYLDEDTYAISTTEY